MQQSGQVVPAHMGDAVDMEEQSPPSTLTSSMKRLPGQLASEAPLTRRVREDVTTEVDLNREARAFRDLFRP